MPMSTSDRHLAASESVKQAVSLLREALKHEANLEWSGCLKDLIMDAEWVGKKLQDYAGFAKREETQHDNVVA